jgi:hypothetical protein
MVFETIKNLQPYFFSLRQIEDNICLDIKLPVNWKFDNIITKFNETSLLNFKIQDKNENFVLLSLVSDISEQGYTKILDCAKEIININKEMEEKENLFQLKIKELQTLFLNESLDKLKDLSFTENEKQGITTVNNVVREGNKKGPQGDTSSQEKDD